MVVFYENNNKFLLKLRRSLINPYFLTQTKLNFSSSTSSNTITVVDKCTLVRDLRKLFQAGFPIHQVSSPNLDRTYIDTSCRYLIPNDWKQKYVSMKLLQNILIADNEWVFWKVYFWAGSLLISYSTRMCLSLAKQLMLP